MIRSRRAPFEQIFAVENASYLARLLLDQQPIPDGGMILRGGGFHIDGGDMIDGPRPRDHGFAAMDGHHANRLAVRIVIVCNLRREERPPAEVVQNVVHDCPMSIWLRLSQHSARTGTSMPIGPGFMLSVSPDRPA